MRTLNDYFIDGESINNIQAVDVGSNWVCVPDAGRLIGIVGHVTNAATTAIITFDIIHNGSVDTGVDALLPITAQNAGLVMNLDGQVILAAGDRLKISSNGGGVGTPRLFITWIIRR